MSGQTWIAQTPQHAAIENTIGPNSTLNIRGATDDYLAIRLSASGSEPGTAMACYWRTGAGQRAEATSVMSAFLTADHLVIHDDVSATPREGFDAALATEGLQEIGS